MSPGAPGQQKEPPPGRFLEIELCLTSFARVCDSLGRNENETSRFISFQCARFLRASYVERARWRKPLTPQPAPLVVCRPLAIINSVLQSIPAGGVPRWVDQRRGYCS